MFNHLIFFLVLPLLLAYQPKLLDRLSYEKLVQDLKPNWFRKGSSCTLSYKDMLTNLSAYIRTSNEDKRNAILEEVVKLSFKKNPIYSANLLRYSLLP